MTEIPMPSDYSPQQPPQQQKGCCTRICECWLYLLIAGLLFVVLMFILFTVWWGSWFSWLP